MEPTIYLFFNGNCLEAMQHYAEVLGGEVVDVFRNGDAPDAESRMPGGDDLILNLSLKLPTGTMMASDATADWYEKPAGFRVSLALSSRAEFDRIYDALAIDATSVMMPPMETFWAERFTMFTDRYGTPWMLNFAGSKGGG
jgi:PhnB protein